MVLGEQPVETGIGPGHHPVVFAHLHVARLDHDARRRPDQLVEFENLGVNDRLAVAHAGRLPGQHRFLAGDDRGRDDRAEQITLAALVETGVRLIPVRVQHLVVAQLGRAGDLGLDDILHEILGVLAGHNHFATGVGGDVDLRALEREARIGHLDLLPILRGDGRAQPLHLGLVELDGVTGDFLRLLEVRIGLFCHAPRWPQKGAKTHKKNQRILDSSLRSE